MSIQKTTLEQVKRAGAALVDARKALAGDFKEVMDQMAGAIITQPAGLDLDRQFASVKDLARLAHDMASLEDRVKDILVSAMALGERGAGVVRTLNRQATPRLLGVAGADPMVVDVIASAPKAEKAVKRSAKPVAPRPQKAAVGKTSAKAKSPAGGQKGEQKRGAFRAGVETVVKLAAKVPVAKPAAKPAAESAPVQAAAPLHPEAVAPVAVSAPATTQVSAKGPAGKAKSAVKAKPSAKAVALAKPAQPSESPLLSSGTTPLVAKTTPVAKAASTKSGALAPALSGNESKVLAFAKTRLNKKKPAALSGKDVGEGAGIPVGSVSQALKQLITKGKLVSKGDGMYLLG